MAQNPKGGGLSGTFGGTSSAQFGVQRTNDFMEKATWTLSITIVVLILLTIILTANPVTPETKSAPAKTEAPTRAPQTAPGQTPVQQTPASN